MKIFRKIVALSVIWVVAGFPVMARVTCALGMAARVPCTHQCHRAKGGKALSCSMPFQAGRTGCAENCCQNGMQQGVIRADAKPKVLHAELIAILPPAAVSGENLLSYLPVDGRVDTGPPRFILFQVFRI